MEVNKKGIQTCQPLVKVNQETREKKSGDSTKKISEILCFLQTPIPLRELDTNLIPRAHSPFKVADGHGK